MVAAYPPDHALTCPYTSMPMHRQMSELPASLSTVYCVCLLDSRWNDLLMTWAGASANVRVYVGRHQTPRCPFQHADPLSCLPTSLAPCIDRNHAALAGRPDAMPHLDGSRSLTPLYIHPVVVFVTPRLPPPLYPPLLQTSTCLHNRLYRSTRGGGGGGAWCPQSAR